jgi:hypothetical protein
MTTLLLLNVLALAITAWAVIFALIPACLRSLTRHRLWQLRDRVVDELLDGSYEDTEKPMQLVEDAELAIAYLERLSMFNFLVAKLAASGLDLPTKAPLDLSGLSPSDRERLQVHLSEFQRALSKQVLLRTPSGWIITLALLPLVLVITALRHLFGSRDSEGRSVIEDTKIQVRDEVELEPALSLLRSRSAGPGRLTLHV